MMPLTDSAEFVGELDDQVIHNPQWCPLNAVSNAPNRWSIFRRATGSTNAVECQSWSGERFDLVATANPRGSLSGTNFRRRAIHSAQSARL